MQTQLGALAEYMVRICETGSGYTKSFFGVCVLESYYQFVLFLSWRHMQIYQRTERHTQLVIIIDRPTKERHNIFKYGREDTYINSCP